jgi:hypothetical protein
MKAAGWLDIGLMRRQEPPPRTECDAFAANPPPTRKLPGGERAQDTKRECAEVGHLPKQRWGTSCAPGAVLLSHIFNGLHGKAR